ncbi:MAG: hypothetical protein ACR2LR_14440 [Hassallia sp.]
MKQFGPKEKTKQRKTKITELGFDENDRSLAEESRLQHNLTIVSAFIATFNRFNKPEHYRLNPGFETLRTIE